jgi:hypothetical protein
VSLLVIEIDGASVVVVQVVMFHCGWNCSNVGVGGKISLISGTSTDANAGAGIGGTD